MSRATQDQLEANAIALVRHKLAQFVSADKLDAAALALGRMWAEQCRVAEAAGRRNAAEECWQWCRWAAMQWRFLPRAEGGPSDADREPAIKAANVIADKIGEQFGVGGHSACG